MYLAFEDHDAALFFFGNEYQVFPVQKKQTKTVINLQQSVGCRVLVSSVGSGFNGLPSLRQRNFLQ